MKLLLILISLFEVIIGVTIGVAYILAREFEPENNDRSNFEKDEYEGFKQEEHTTDAIPRV